MHELPSKLFAYQGAAAVLFAALCSVHIARAQDVDDKNLQAAIEKANAYIELANETARAVESWERYASWVNMNKGPTGKERYISYGMYELNDATSRIAEARAAAKAPPAAPGLDGAITKYLDTYEALAPVMNKANGYYESQGYESDNAAEGQALHKQMVPLATAFLAERETMLKVLRPFVRDVEGQEVQALQKLENSSLFWHVSNVVHTANRVFDAFPRERPQQMNEEELEEQMKALGPDTPPEKFDEIIAGAKPQPNLTVDVKAYGAALENYAKAVEAFEKFDGKNSEDLDKDFIPLPSKLLTMLRAFNGPLQKSQGKEFEGSGQMAGQIVNVYFEMWNAAGSARRTQLRYLQ